MRQSIRTEVEKCKTQNLTLNIFLPLSPSVSSSASCLMMSVIFSPIFCAGLQMRMRSIEGWGTDMRRSEWKFRELKPYQVMITMNDPQFNPQQGLKWCNLAQNSQTFPTWPFIFQNIAFAASFWQPMPNLLSKKIFHLNQFNETSSCSEIRPWSKLASTLKNKAGQIVCQILSSNMKEQKLKKTFPFNNLTWNWPSDWIKTYYLISYPTSSAQPPSNVSTNHKHNKNHEI